MVDFEPGFEKLKPGMIVAVGIPLDENSSFMRGSAKAPPRIREALHSKSTNLCAETGLDLSGDARWKDIGDLTLASAGLNAFTQIEQAIELLLGKDIRVLSLGGDHSITLPIIRAYAKKYPGLTILHLDAHPDLYDEYEGNRYSHACTFARIMEERLVNRLVQVGIRTMNPLQQQQVERFGVEVVDMRTWSPDTLFEFDDPLYLSIDMDVLDPAFAPGVSHHEPGGLTTRDALSIIQNARATVVGADIVEFNPTRDPIGITAMAAAKLVKEVIARMVR